MRSARRASGTVRDDEWAPREKGNAMADLIAIGYQAAWCPGSV
ncbi:MAG TPA: hypothetical protein VF223_13755 [Trebonia sp.]